MIKGGVDGIDSFNKTTGAAAITVSGAVTGAGGDAIHAVNYSTATDLIITTSAASTMAGTNIGIYALNNGTGATTITANGVVTGQGAYGIDAVNGATATDLIITTGAASTVTGTNVGIYALNNGTGVTTITANGAVTGTNAYGIEALNSSTGTKLTVTTGDASTVTGATMGIHALNKGTGATIVTAGGIVTGTASDGIYAGNTATATDLIITTDADSTVTGKNGIVAVNNGTGATTITTNGTVTGPSIGIYALSNGIGTKTTITANGTVSGLDGIEAKNAATAGDLIITTGAASTVTGTNIGIVAVNNGTGATIVTANGAVTGTGADGIYAVNASTATDLTITTGTASTVTGVDGIVAVNNGTGATTITTYGTVAGTNFGIYALNKGIGTKTTITANGTVTGYDGIEAVNSSTAGDLIITTGAASAVTGTNIGIVAVNNGTGATTITANGAVTGTATDGIYASNASTATNLIITTGADSVVSGLDGIVAVNNGTGATTITTNGTVSGTNIGIYALNNGTGTTTITADGTVTGVDGIEAKNAATAGDLIITTGAASTVTGTNIGIVAVNNGTGATTITVNGAVTGTGADGIYAGNSSTAGDLIITTGDTSTVTGVNGIVAVNNGTGATTITTNGTVTGTNIGIYALNNGTGTKTTITANGAVTGLDGIEAVNSSTAGDLIITTGATSTVTGTNIGIYAVNKGTGATTITTYGTVSGLNGIATTSSGTAGDLIITTGAASTVTGTNIGIVAINSGIGATTIAAYGTVSGLNGIAARNYGTAGDLTITTGAASTVTGTNIGIVAVNQGTGATMIAANGTVSGVNGILATNYGTAGDLTITTGAASTVTGTNVGIVAINSGIGATTIAAYGTVSGLNAIAAKNYGTAGDLKITTGAAGAVTGTNIGIYALNQGTGTTTITTAGVTQGGVAGIAAVSSAGQAIAINNSGIVRNSSALSSALAIETVGGATAIANSGRLIGTVALGDLGSTVDNSGTWNTAGGTNTFGALIASNGVTNEAGGTIVAADDASATQQTVFTNVGTFTNAGTLTMLDGRAGDTATINGNFVGTGGTVALDTVIGTDGSLSDELVINGNASGSTRLAINNVGGTGGLTTANGIEVVDVTGTSTSDAFRLAAAVGAGIYDYGLYYSSLTPNADDQNWYLRSTGELNASTQTVRPYADTLVNFAEATLGTLEQRTGNRVWPNGASQVAADLPSDQVMKYAATGPIIRGAGAWGRVGGQYGSFDPKTGSPYTQSLGFLQAGYEGTAAETTAGDVTVGAFATVGTSNAQVDITHDPVTGAVRSNGKITSTGYGLGANLTWLGDDGFYADGIGQFTWYDTDLSNKAGGSNSGWSSVLSLEAGKRFEMGSGWAIVPQTQLAWTHVDFSPFTDTNDAPVSMGDGDSLKGRVGVRVENLTSWWNVIGPAKRLQLYGVVNLSYQFLNGTSVVVAGNSLIQENQRLWGQRDPHRRGARSGRRADRRAAGIRRAGSRAVRLLHPGHGRRHPRPARSQRPRHGAGAARGDLRKSVPLHRLRPDLRCVPPSTGGTDPCRRLACHRPSPASAARPVSARAYCDPTRRRRPRGGSRSRPTCGWTACCGAGRCAARSRTLASSSWTPARRCSSPACTRSSPTTTCGAAAPTASSTMTSRSSPTRSRCSTASRSPPSPRTTRRSPRGPSRRSRSSTTCWSHSRIRRRRSGRRRERSTPTATCSGTSGCGTVTRAPSARSSSRAVTRSARRTRRSSAPSPGWRCPSEDGGVELFIATQWLHVDRDQIAACLNLPRDKVRLTLSGTGGAFGGREDLSMQIHACLLAWSTKKPIKMVYSREESFFGHVHRHPARLWYRHHADRDGNLVNVECRMVFDGGAYASSSTAVISNATSFAAGPYLVPNAAVDGYAVRTNNPPCGAMRGFGAVQTSFAAEAQMDKLADALGMDPIELRLRNALKTHDMLLTGQVIIGTAPVAECITACRDLPMPEPLCGRRADHDAARWCRPHRAAPQRSSWGRLRRRVQEPGVLGRVRRLRHRAGAARAGADR